MKNMRKMMALLLATAVLCIGTTAFASEENENVSDDSASGAALMAPAWNGRGDSGNTQSSIPKGSAAFFLQLNGLQMDTNGNISGRPTSEFTGVVATAKLKNPNRSTKNSIATGGGVTEADILAAIENPPADDAAFDSARGQLMYKGYIRSNKGDVIPWSKLTSKNYSIDWYVLKYEKDDGWHVDGRILDMATKDVIDIVIPDNPKDIPEEAYDDVTEEEKKDDKDDDEEVTADTSIDLSGATYAYIFGYEPTVQEVMDDEGNVKYTARVRMGMDDSVTVEQVSAMLTRLLDREGYTKNLALKITPSVEPYRGTWFARGLAYQCAVGGLDSEGSLQLGNVSRGRVAKLVSHALKLSKTKNTPFTDIDGSEYEEDIKKVYAYGYMSGVSDDSFDPNSIMTRAEFCKLFNNIIGRDRMGLTALDENGEKYQITAEDYSFVDMSPWHWAYEECLKATSAYDDDGYVSISKRQDNIRNKVDEYDSQLLY